MSGHTVDAYLGDFADRLSDDQKGDLARVFAQVGERYLDLDDHGVVEPWSDSAEEGWTAAAQIALGDSTLTEVSERWLASRLAERQAMAAMTGAMLWSALSMSEAQIVEATGINRMTVRKAMGK